jgi:hypothetical protein
MSALHFSEAVTHTAFVAQAFEQLRDVILNNRDAINYRWPVRVWVRVTQLHC